MKTISLVLCFLCGLQMMAQERSLIPDAASDLMNYEKNIHQLELKTANIASQINQLESKIKIMSDGLNERKKNLSARIQTYQQLIKNKWSVLLKLNNVAQFQRVSEGLQKINTRDIQAIRENLFKIEEIQNEKKKLVLNFKNFKNLTENIKVQNIHLNKIEDQERKNLTNSNLPSLLRSKGFLMAPLEGKVGITLRQGFGLKKHRSDATSMSLILNQYSLFSKGYLYSISNSSEKVQAIGPGKVIFSDVLPYWGESIIIQHDGNYHSVYAGIKGSPLVVDQSIFGGEIVGTIANDFFYFELRHGSTPINPKTWIKDLK